MRRRLTAAFALVVAAATLVVGWHDEDGRSLQRPWRAWPAPTLEVESEQPIAAPIDGEALVLDAPQRNLAKLADGPHMA